MGLGGFLADGASRVKRSELSKAVPVDGMATGHLVGSRSRTEEVLLTDRAVGHIFACLAIMIIEKEGINTHSTVMAMSEVITSSHPTESTIGAMVGFLFR